MGPYSHVSLYELFQTYYPRNALDIPISEAICNHLGDDQLTPMAVDALNVNMFSDMSMLFLRHIEVTGTAMGVFACPEYVELSTTVNDVKWTQRYPRYLKRNDNGELVKSPTDAMLAYAMATELVKAAVAKVAK